LANFTRLNYRETAPSLAQDFCFFLFNYREKSRPGERRAALAGAHGVDSKKATSKRA
jgi:hypothetical protein